MSSAKEYLDDLDLLAWVAKEGDMTMCLQLAKAGANFNKEIRPGVTPLSLFLTSDDKENEVYKILSKPFCPN